MTFEDGTTQTQAALRLLQSQKDELGCPNLQIQSGPEFLEQAKSMRLTRHDREVIVEQATLLVDQFYAHLPFKRARYASDPVQHFRLIHAQLDHLTDLEFHAEMIRAFMRLRDAHTFYGLPAPFRGAFAFLPFRMDCYYAAPDRRHFVVTSMMEGFEHPTFGVGAEIVLWSGMPVERAIEREADFEPGCNAAARFVRGMKRLTKRTLTFSAPPDEHFVVVQYIPAAGRNEPTSIVIPWSIATACIPVRERKSASSSLNESLAQLKQLEETLWRRGELAKERMLAQANSGDTPPAVDLRQESVYPRVFAFQYTGGAAQPDLVDPAQMLDPAHPDRKFGYIRIKTFDLEGDENASDHFFTEFLRILDLMQEVAPDGLVLDVRSNPGGAIDAAERILQLMTPLQIEPANFHFINSRVTQQIASKLRDKGAHGALDANQREWMPWVEDLLASVTSGFFVTPGRPLTSPDWANDTGQRYQGPVALLIDASSYSATDIFAAGFQDHRIGTVIGVDQNTGGGGANRWLHEDLRQMLEKVMPSVPLKKLPGDAQMGLALRRSSRVGRNAGNVIEDEGVGSDVKYQVTRNDVLNHDHDLIRFACLHLSSQLTGQLQILSADLRPDGIALTLKTRNVFRLECSLDGRPQCSFAADAPQPFLIPRSGLIDTPSLLQVDGLAMVAGDGGVQQLQLVARDTFEFDASTAPATAAATTT
jgi:hypothetical protein